MIKMYLGSKRDITRYRPFCNSDCNIFRIKFILWYKTVTHEPPSVDRRVVPGY
jgi:hypothetical protein